MLLFLFYVTYNLVQQTTFTVLDQTFSNFVHVLRMGWRCARHNFHHPICNLRYVFLHKIRYFLRYVFLHKIRHFLRLYHIQPCEANYFNSFEAGHNFHHLICNLHNVFFYIRYMTFYVYITYNLVEQTTFTVLNQTFSNFVKVKVDVYCLVSMLQHAHSTFH